jgi:peptidoglycan/xylan/chitin deacetylase (PgdA/CDA1 family)
MRAILTYHSIDGSGSPISCDPATFGRHVSWLATGRVRVTTIAELLQLPDDADAVALTFDDGFVNFKDEAAPRLREHGFPVTVFVVAARVGANNSWDGPPSPNPRRANQRRIFPTLQLLDWPDLIRLQEQGVTLGAHSRTHRSLPGLTANELEDEVQGCAEQIEARAGRRPTVFAYPYGRRDAASTEAVARVFRLACTTEFQPLSSQSHAFALPRLDMGYFKGPRSLDGWGTPWFKTRLSVRHGLRRVRRLGMALRGPA